jgi:hypothetical protein
MRCSGCKQELGQLVTLLELLPPPADEKTRLFYMKLLLAGSGLRMDRTCCLVSFKRILLEMEPQKQAARRKAFIKTVSVAPPAQPSSKPF